MSTEDNQDQNRGGGLRERIVSQLRANEQARRNPITAEELAQLRSAASRLERMLKISADADRQALQSAAVRLDQLLNDIRGGKNINNHLKRRR